MNDRRTIVAIVIAIVLSCPGGSPEGCAALTVPIRETVATEISIPTTGITDETKQDDPLGRMVLEAVVVARDLLKNSLGQFQRYVERAQWILTAIETPFLESNNDASGDRRRRWATESQGLIDQLTNLPLDLSNAPKLLEDLTASIPNVILHPVEFASNVTSNVGGLTANAAGIAANGGLNLLWKFLTTQGLPWLHTTLNNLNQTASLPPTVRNFIMNFDAVYDIAKLLGYIQ